MVGRYFTNIARSTSIFLPQVVMGGTAERNDLKTSSKQGSHEVIEWKQIQEVPIFNWPFCRTQDHFYSLSDCDECVQVCPITLYITAITITTLPSSEEKIQRLPDLLTLVTRITQLLHRIKGGEGEGGWKGSICLARGAKYTHTHTHTHTHTQFRNPDIVRYIVSCVYLWI